MLIRLQKWLIVCALVLSIGGHWAFLQSIAWVNMAVDYSKSSSLSQALEKTFDGHHLCKLCKLIRAGKKAETKQELKLDVKKFDLFAGAKIIFQFHSPTAQPQFGFVIVPQRTEAPLLPPPLFA